MRTHRGSTREDSSHEHSSREDSPEGDSSRFVEHFISLLRFVLICLDSGNLSLYPLAVNVKCR